jgi:3-oxoacyl-[acyl-carrier protein] reductase
MDESKKQIALITGASRGIGRAVAIALARTGRHVCINYCSNKEAATETLKSVEKTGGTGELIPFDVRDIKASEKQ